MMWMYVSLSLFLSPFVWGEDKLKDLVGQVGYHLIGLNVTGCWVSRLVGYQNSKSCFSIIAIAGRFI